MSCSVTSAALKIIAEQQKGKKVDHPLHWAVNDILLHYLSNTVDVFVAASLTLANHNLMNAYIIKALWQNALLFHEAGTWTSIMKFSKSVVPRY